MQRLKATFAQISVMVLLCATITTFAQSPIILNNESEINSSFQEYSPTFYANGVVFIGSNPAVSTEKKEDNQTGKSTTSIFFSQKGDNGLLQKPLTFAEELTTRFYDGPLSFSADGNTVYFTRSNLKKGKPVKSKDGAVKLKIYSAQKVNDKWINITELPFNSSEFDCAHPSVSQDGRRLYFTSNRKEGFGGMDLYVSTLINGTWSEPVNMGPKVNSGKDEVFPSVHADGKVYYSSNGRQGIGNLDIFYTIKTDTGWLLPRLLPEPINSRSDDFSFALAADKKTGYFASNRASGKGDDDIFSFTAPETIEMMIDVQLSASDDIVNNESSPIEQPKTETEVETVTEAKKEDSAVLNPTSTPQTETKSEAFAEEKKEDSATLNPTPTLQTDTKVETLAEVKKQDSATPEQPLVKTEALVSTTPEEKKETKKKKDTKKKENKEPKVTTQVAIAEVKTQENTVETTQVNKPTPPSEPAFDEVAITKTDATQLELPSDKPLKKLSEPELPLSKTDISETAIVTSTEFNTEGGDEKSRKLEDSSLKPLKEPLKLSAAKKKSKAESKDKILAQNNLAYSNDDVTVHLTTSSQMKNKYLVVVGTYSIKKNAIDQKKIAIDKGFPDTEIIQYEDNHLFGVCVKHFDDENAAQSLARSILQQKKMEVFVKVIK